MAYQKPSEYQCQDCGEIPIRNGVCPHGCPNGKTMRLAYNYTTNEYAVYAPEHESIVLFSLWDDGDTVSAVISDGDTYAIYDVSHWVGHELEKFDALVTEAKVIYLSTLPKIRGASMALSASGNPDTPLR